ncbi:MAG: gamma-glutamyltransferase, partial [Actinobacteria bacterium]|nr:gamma-glutamyltransferase [Actinomycetota bacterium]
RMRGAIAGGHPLTAEAGARVLAEGGNAVDACIAACFASWVAESPLTGPGGGGFMLVHRARDRSTRVLDFFVTAPGLGLEPGGAAAMEAVDVDFSGGSSQVFRIGAASCAVPGTVAGLEAAHRAYASLPWRELIRPAAELARSGLELTRPQAYLHAILDLILRHTPEGRAVYGEEGRLVAGERLTMSDLAGTLELLAHEGAAVLYRGELARALAEHVREAGGTITERDLAEFRVVRRRPVGAVFRGHAFASNPPPSAGGILIGYALGLLERIGTDAAPGSAEAIAALAEVMREQGRARARGFERALHRGGLPQRLRDEEALALGRIANGDAGVPEHSTPGGTTHISAIDGRGNAAALTVSTGSGSGIVVPGTGIQLNNMLGEFDLPRAPRPGTRLSSMMSPTLVSHDGRPRLVVGSAGSLRLRSAVLQVVVNVVAHGLPVEEAVERPRVHLEEPHLHCEGGTDPAEVDRLLERGYQVVRWRRRNLYFGGAAAVEVLPDGSLAAAGDPRRGGAGVVVE